MLRILFRYPLTVVLLWFLQQVLDAYFDVAGGWKGLLILGAVVTLLNLTVRPLLNLATFPIRFFTGVIASILVNAVFLWITIHILDLLDTEVLAMYGGLTGWLVVSLALGIGSWLIRLMTTDRS